jgi:hypothetical protein
VSRNIEIRVIDPHRIAHAQRHRGELLAITRRAAQTTPDVIAQLVEARRAPAGGVNLAAQPTCMCAVWLSTSRNDASSAVN